MKPSSQRNTNTSVLVGYATPARRRWRAAKDHGARHSFGFGGISVIIAILLIFFYLLYVVFPIFRPAEITPVASYGAPGDTSQTLHLATDELAKVGARITRSGKFYFFETATGKIVHEHGVSLTGGARITSFTSADPVIGLVGMGLSDGRVLALRHVFEVSYPNDVRTITPRVRYPLGQEPITVIADSQAVHRLALRVGEEEATVVAVTTDRKLFVTSFAREESLLGGKGEWKASDSATLALDILPAYVLMDPEQRLLYVADQAGELRVYDIVDKGDLKELQRLRLTTGDRRITAMRFLLGGISLLIGDSSGRVSQWLPTRDQDNRYALVRVRQFGPQGLVTEIAPEERRKGFLVADAKGRIGIYHATAHRTLLIQAIDDKPVRHLAGSPRGDALLSQGVDGRMRFFHVENEHPELSWSALWDKVWYESYDEPRFIWQSSAATQDFEPKFSLTPLTFGTLKAAFYAMLLAMPLSIMGAIYTAYFMSPGMRQVVKPTLEIMEALPTVILGFLAGLWLAPFVEAHLPGLFSLFLIMPLGVLMFAYVWDRLPKSVRSLIPDGWQAAILIPVVIGITWLSFGLSYPMEQLFFGGDIRRWLTDTMGIGFDQRNSIVVGLAMGFAVIPSIFSIAEDAIFAVPKHLTHGSLALGATPWQTLTRVVILTASPGIFSAIMIGMGRAVGETMIVLMATGNTPVMDFSVFQGMRTLSANIAVEMPESEVGSSHYRVLFLAALILFMFTFVVNTLAEIIRQRLRKKYSSL